MGLVIVFFKFSIVYVLIEVKKNGFYKFIDGGFKWKLVFIEDIGNCFFYYVDIFVDFQNENWIFNFWFYLFKLEDGGKIFELFGWGIYLDYYVFWVYFDNFVYMIEGNDGGLNISYDGGDIWCFV